jgi:hypothetical protein
MADTLVTNIAESTQEIIEATQLMLPQYSPTMNLVTRLTIAKGNNEAELPFVNSFPTVQTPTEGDELTITSQFDLSSTTIAPTRRAIMVRVTRRAERFSKEQLIAVISDWLARAEAVNIEEDLIAEFTNFHTANDVGTTNVDLTLATLRTAKRLLDSVTAANGGPAPVPISCVISPIAAENLLTDLGVAGVVATTAPWIPAGLSEELIKQYALQGGSTFQLLGSGVFVSSAFVNNASGDHICGMFSKKALYLAMAEDWDMKSFEESNWDGAILRALADYKSGVGPYSRWGAQITADGV